MFEERAKWYNLIFPEAGYYLYRRVVNVQKGELDPVVIEGPMSYAAASSYSFSAHFAPAFSGSMWARFHLRRPK